MDEDIELVSDGDGVAVLGDPAAVEQFLSSADVVSKDFPPKWKLGAAMGAAGGMAQSGSQIAENSGRWVKLTGESAKALKLGTSMKGSSDGLSRAIAITNKGKVTKILEFTKPGSIGSMLTNPAILFFGGTQSENGVSTGRQSIFHRTTVSGSGRIERFPEEKGGGLRRPPPSSRRTTPISFDLDPVDSHFEIGCQLDRSIVQMTVSK